MGPFPPPAACIRTINISLSLCSLCFLSFSALCFAAAPAAVFCSCARCWSISRFSSTFLALIWSIIFHFLKLGSKVPPVVPSFAPTAEVGAPPATGAGWCRSSIISRSLSSSAAWASSAASSAVVRFRVLGLGGGVLCAGCRRAFSIF